MNTHQSLAEWIENEDLMPEVQETAVIWPKSFDYARSIGTESDIRNVIVTSNRENDGSFRQLKGVRELDMYSHDLAYRLPEQFDLEYGWALGDNTVDRGPEDNNSVEEVMREIARTSDRMLRPGGVAVYNLETTGGREELGFDSDLEYAERMKVILEDELDISPKIYNSPDMRYPTTHLTWQKDTI
jgi:hypothetical protein